jgi:hypothetical protein
MNENIKIEEPSSEHRPIKFKNEHEDFEDLDKRIEAEESRIDHLTMQLQKAKRALKLMEKLRAKMEKEQELINQPLPCPACKQHDEKVSQIELSFTKQIQDSTEQILTETRNLISELNRPSISPIREKKIGELIWESLKNLVHKLRTLLKWSGK